MNTVLIKCKILLLGITCNKTITSHVCLVLRHPNDVIETRMEQHDLLFEDCICFCESKIITLVFYGQGKIVCRFFFFSALIVTLTALVCIEGNVVMKTFTIN